MRHRWFLPVLVLSVMSMALPARADDPVDEYTGRLAELEQRAAAREPFTSEARAARVEALWPDMATSLIELQVAASEAVSEVIQPTVAS